MVVGVDALFQRETMLLAALEGSQDCVKLIGRDGRILYVNSGGHRLLELDDPTAALGACWADFWPKAARPRVLSALSLAFANASDRFQETCPTARGTLKHWDVLLTPLANEGGDVAVVLVTSRDISDLVTARAEAEAAERALARHAAALQSAGRIAKIGGWEIDVRTSEVHWSEEIWALLGGRPRPISLPEAMGIYAEKDRTRVLRVLEQAQQSGERVTFEAQVSRFDGTQAPIRVFGEPVYEAGVCVALRGAAQDITEVATAQASLEGAERRLRMAVAMSDILVYEVDYQQRRLFSEGDQRLFFEHGLTYDQMLRDPYVGVAPQDRQQVVEAWEASQRTGEPYRAEYRVARSDGREIWASSRCWMETDSDGRPIRLVGALQNITERKVAEQELIAARDRAEAGSRAKDEFLAMVSHEIRTPLNGVLGMAQAMANDALSPPQQRRLDVVRRSGEVLLELLNNVLDLAKIESGLLELDSGGVADVADLARKTAEGFTGQLSEKEVSLLVEIEPRAEGCFVGDPARLGQVLRNVLSNAVKFTERGSITLRLTRPDDVLILEASDTGVGIAADRLNSIFQKFVQADSSTTRRFGGSGLGLAITRELVDLMGGTISVRSALGEGSVFTVELPLVRTGPAPREEEVTPPPPEATRDLYVLVAEDNEVNQLVLRTLLEQIGIIPTVVANGAEAVETWSTGCWDLIFMDIQMPVMDGVRATQEIRRREAMSGQAPIPIIALTANVMQHQVEQYTSAGMDAVVGKPIQFAEILAAIKHVMVRHMSQTATIAAGAAARA